LLGIRASREGGSNEGQTELGRDCSAKWKRDMRSAILRLTLMGREHARAAFAEDLGNGVLASSRVNHENEPSRYWTATYASNSVPFL
jgi:hypothetical protein